MRAWPGPREDDTRRPHILNEELFRSVLVKERKRSDRSNRPFGLLLLSVPDGGPLESSAIWDAIVDALTAATRDTDIMGWFEAPGVMGVLVPEISASDQAAAPEKVRTRVRQELATRLDTATLRAVSLQLHVYPELRQTGEEGYWSVDPLLYPDLRPRRSRLKAYDVIKRVVDVAGSLTLLLTLSPLFLFIAILVKLTSRGSVILRQVRIGQMVKPFPMFKFRTMRSNADPRLHLEFVSSFIKANGQAHQSGKNGSYKLTNDPRVTRIGRILRSTSLDELPQLWNVLRGDMSLVGPRPPLPYELEHYQPWHRRRVLEAKPGVTGLWQVFGRSRTTFDEMVRLDLRYARERSLWTDFKILMATPAAVISRKGAH